MKTIKVIQLLNSIANKNSIPEKIKYEDNIYTLHGSRDYYCEDIGRYFFEEIMSTDSVDNVMNEEVEIIEDKLIEHLQYIQEQVCGGIEERVIIDGKHLANKINEIIDVINEMKENKEEK